MNASLVHVPLNELLQGAVKSVAVSDICFAGVQ